LAFAGGVFDQVGGVPFAEENLQALQFQPALEQVNLRRFAGTIQPFHGNQASREIQFGKGLHHSPTTKLLSAPPMTRFSTPPSSPMMRSGVARGADEPGSPACGVRIRHITRRTPLRCLTFQLAGQPY